MKISFSLFRVTILSVLVGLVSSVSSAGVSLETKLEEQWKKYGAAREALMTQLTAAPAAGNLARDQWELILTPDAANKMDAGDLKALKANQKRRIRFAKTRAQLQSVFDLRNVSQRGLSEEFCKAVPKGGMLHIHPGGTLDRETVARLLNSGNPLLQFQAVLTSISNSGGKATLTPEETTWIAGLGADRNFLALNEAERVGFTNFFFLPAGKNLFSRFNSVFRFLDYTLSDWNSYGSALMDFAKRAVREGVSYAEFSSSFSPDLEKVLVKIRQETGLEIRINRSFNRTLTIEELDQRAKQLLAQPANPWLVGIDFLDKEDTNPALEKGQRLYGQFLKEFLAGRTHLHRTMHAGEIGDVRNPRDAMILGAERLGHAVLLQHDPVAMEYAARNGVAVEVNLTSNLRLTEVNALKSHPYLDYLRLGIPVSLSTDDEGIFETDINQDCRLAVNETDITYYEFKQMADNSIRTSFATDADKSKLLARLKTEFARFEREFAERLK